jgi:nitronate monooxygenase
MNQLLSRLGLRWPVLQAPTGSIAGPELAAAVSEAGAMGGPRADLDSPGRRRRGSLCGARGHRPAVLG